MKSVELETMFGTLQMFLLRRDREEANKLMSLWNKAVEDTVTIPDKMLDAANIFKDVFASGELPLKHESYFVTPKYIIDTTGIDERRWLITREEDDIRVVAFHWDHTFQAVTIFRFSETGLYHKIFDGKQLELVITPYFFKPMWGNVTNSAMHRPAIDNFTAISMLILPLFCEKIK